MTKKLLVKRRRKALTELTQEIPSNGIITVGNDASATIELKDEKIAPEQLVIVCENDSMTLLCRVDGTSVNGEKLPQGALHQLRLGDEIAVNGYTLIPEGDSANGNGADPVGSSVPRFAAIPESDPESVPTVSDRPERSLSDVLENLRAEEKFYFLISKAGDEDRRVYVENEEMWLGWTKTGDFNISANPLELDAARGQVRKDWSGVVLYPLKAGNVKLNDELPTDPRRLKNDDRISFAGRESSRLAADVSVRFHEPTALLILDAILPRELPPPILLDAATADIGSREIDEADLVHSSKVPPLAKKDVRRGNIFGYFTITEIIIMAIGTLITAAVIFLILELY